MSSNFECSEFVVQPLTLQLEKQVRWARRFPTHEKTRTDSFSACSSPTKNLQINAVTLVLQINDLYEIMIQTLNATRFTSLYPFFSPFSSLQASVPPRHGHFRGPGESCPVSCCFQCKQAQLEFDSKVIVTSYRGCTKTHWLTNQTCYLFSKRGSPPARFPTNTIYLETSILLEVQKPSLRRPQLTTNKLR